jgi:hypothetical protein
MEDKRNEQPRVALLKQSRPTRCAVDRLHVNGWEAKQGKGERKLRGPSFAFGASLARDILASLCGRTGVAGE